MGSILSIKNVKKSFGTHNVLKDLSFEVPEHSVYGFIGQNGAGKTTTMKLILGLYTLDAGEILIDGTPVVYGNTKTNKNIGYLPDVPEFYSYMTPTEYLTLCGQIAGMDVQEIRKRISELTELVGLSADRNRRIHGFSRGMKQRLGIAQALINEPKLLICDEPTSALDPIGRKEILEILELAKEKTTVIFSTHILTDVERICDNIGLLNEGRLVLQTSMGEIHKLHGDDGFVVEFSRKEAAEIFASSFMGGVPRPEVDNSLRLIYPNAGEAELHIAMSLIVDKKLPVKKIEMLEPSLENLFVKAVEK